jgi:ectoine hydroxylase-related dioxygenase (phytanoyl-CoA dioxygenase family)
VGVVRETASRKAVTPHNQLEVSGASRKVARMTDEILRQRLDRDGYVVMRGLLPPDQIGEMLDECRDVLRLQMRRHGIAGSESTGAAFDAALADLFRLSMKSYIGAARLTQYLPSLHRMGAGGPLIDLVRSLGLGRPVISTRPVVHIVSDALAVPNGYHRTPAHQDWRSVQGSLDALVVWLPFVDVEHGRNTLEVVPGSHRKGLMPTVPHAFGTEVEAGLLADSDFVPLTAVPGDVIALSMFLVHRTGKAVGPNVRWAASFRYNNLDEASFIARDFPNPYIYKPREDLLLEDFPAPADIARVFGDD